jgi:hypothetical protein
MRKTSFAPPRLRVPAIVLSMTLAFTVLACDGTEAVEPMPRDTFIGVMVELRRAASEAGSQAEFDVRKAEILARANVTDSTLTAYVRAHARELDHMAEVWDSVHARLRAAEDSIQQ